jgi:hypothetical protein
MLNFRTIGAWGAGLARNLHPAEVDANFYQLDQRLADVEGNPVLPKEIEDFTVVGNQLTITMTGGATFGPFTLPAAAFSYTGEFQADHDYEIYDILYDPATGLYLVLQEHTTDSIFNPNESSAGMPFYQLILPLFGATHDIGFFYPGTPGGGIAADQAMLTFRASRTIYLPASLPDSTIGVEEAATDVITIPIFRNATQVGTATIAPGETVGTFSFAADVQFDAGHRLRFIRPDTLDATAIDLSVNIQAVVGAIP